uniref:uncharacterized protein LOC123460290 n=1 Tax=Jaculus jaculus TaxID=51337 RepID=UPI001E1B19A8|nr:uncharacterized protein LOC123460290 [Jaculus jaculus]
MLGRRCQLKEGQRRRCGRGRQVARAGLRLGPGSFPEPYSNLPLRKAERKASQIPGCGQVLSSAVARHPPPPLSPSPTPSGSDPKGVALAGRCPGAGLAVRGRGREALGAPARLPAAARCSRGCIQHRESGFDTWNFNCHCVATREAMIKEVTVTMMGEKYQHLDNIHEAQARIVPTDVDFTIAVRSPGSSSQSTLPPTTRRNAADAELRTEENLSDDGPALWNNTCSLFGFSLLELGCL